TTYPPIVYSNVTISVSTTLAAQAQRDTDLPDLGYHYDPLDYAVSALTLANNLNHIVRYNTVQEQSTTNWASGAGYSVSYGSTNASAQCTFTAWSVLGTAGADHVYWRNGGYNPSWFAHNQFGGGGFFRFFWNYPVNFHWLV